MERFGELALLQEETLDRRHDKKHDEKKEDRKEKKEEKKEDRKDKKEDDKDKKHDDKKEDRKEKKEGREAKKEDKKEGKKDDKKDRRDDKKDDKKEDKKDDDDTDDKGKCMNPTDEAKFPDLVNDMKGCGAEIKKNHWRGLKALGEFKKCMNTQYGFTKDCTKCQGTFVACRALHCTKKCNAEHGKPEQLWEEPCFACVAMCGEKMTKCGGLDEAPMAQCQKMLAG